MVKTEFMIIDVKSVAQRLTCVSLILLFIKEMSLVVAQEIYPVLITPTALQIMLRTSCGIPFKITMLIYSFFILTTFLVVVVFLVAGFLSGIASNLSRFVSITPFLPKAW